MLKKENAGDSETGAGNNRWARVCDACRAAACTVYCKADSAYLCSTCDGRIHAANRLASRHERVWVCEACERAPAKFLCKADAASLCTACDSSIHSANPLARRHQRVPILPISGNGYSGGRSSNEEEELMTFVNIMEDHHHHYGGEEEIIEGEVEDETASWLVINNYPVMKKEINVNGLLFGGDSDEYLDFVEYNSNNNNNHGSNHNQHYDYGDDNKSYGDESVVPVQCEEDQGEGEGEGGNHHLQFHNFQLGFDLFESSKSGYSSTNHGVPVSSMDVGMASDSTMEEVSNISSQYSRPPKGTIDLFSNPSIQMSTLLSPRDREARVLRYREKKKMRKFEKTIRYASRKAYAETRPRIKGRFAKRSTDYSHVEDEVDHMFAQTGFSIVPGF